MSGVIKPVSKGSVIRLGAISADGPPDISRKEAEKELEKMLDRLEELQEVLYAQNKHKILVVLQGKDTSGKDGTVRSIFGPLNPQGVRVINFKTPSHEELAHDYLWRAHNRVPRTGEIGIFNRSHYEDVLIARVHALVPADVWKRRYRQINDFERMLHEEGTSILKFYLHIDKDEQKKRLEERLQNPDKHWKIDISDVMERTVWGKYTRAYEDALSKTSTAWAPWYIIPSNHKWFRNYLIASVVTEALEKLDMHYPPAPEGIGNLVIS